MAGRVVAVSVAQPRAHAMFGRPVVSSIVREAAPGPVLFAPGGPLGNATAVHTEDVFVFFAEHYDLWAARLGIDRACWRDCFWGENLLLEGMPGEEALRIGDRFRVGEAVLEVTSPRIPCFKLAWRLGQPESFLRDLIASGRMGCYMRVIAPGRVEAGDAVEVVAEATDAISVMALTRLLHDPAADDLDVLRATLATPGLGGQAAGMIRKRLTALTDGRLPARGRWEGWRRFHIDEIVEEALDTKSFYLMPKDEGPLGGYRAGQFLAVRLPASAGSVVRTWSLSGYGSKAARYRITVKRQPQGKGSCWLHDIAQVGDELDLRSPAGQFMLDRSGFLRTVLISAGIGVTPLLAMLKAHRERGQDAPPLLWIHAARNGAAHILGREADALLAELPSAVRRIFYSAPEASNVLGSQYDRRGHFGSDAIAELLKETYQLSPFGREIELAGIHSDFYICGPSAFEEAVRTALVTANVNADAIQSEHFARLTSRSGEPSRAPTSALVRFEAAGQSLIWQRDDGLTLLELAEAHGLSPEHCCRIGECGSCTAQLLAGEVEYDRPPLAPPAVGHVLLCCCRPASRHLVIAERRLELL